jgi:hypothetical protein
MWYQFFNDVGGANDWLQDVMELSGTVVIQAGDTMEWSYIQIHNLRVINIDLPASRTNFRKSRNFSA